MLLKNIIPSYYLPSLTAAELNTKIVDVISDSRKATTGAMFFALKGINSNGIDYVDKAIENGACVIIYNEDELLPNITKKIISIKSSDINSFLIFTLNNFFSNIPKNIFAVTGTNGKSSVASFFCQITSFLGIESASIGTLGVNPYIKGMVDCNLTTYDIITLYKNLSILKENNIDNVIIEASSIGLEQNRIDGLNIKVASFTNFSQDHLDYHGNMERYFSSKMKLFSKLTKNSNVVINSDIAKYKEIHKICLKSKNTIYQYGYKLGDIKLISSSGRIDGREGQDITFLFKNQKYNLQIPLLGDFQALNILCALLMVYIAFKLDNLSIKKIITNFANLKNIHGRMDHVATLSNNAKIYIDFAHTPDALKNILTNARHYTSSKLIILFGCGGDRDQHKRQIMGNIASNLSDLVVITDDNPRTENLSQIRKHIIFGCKSNNFIEIENRKIAIEQTISILKKNDILIIAGKGHECYQVIGKDKIPFNEKDIINNYLAKNNLL